MNRLVWLMIGALVGFGVYAYGIPWASSVHWDAWKIAVAVLGGLVLLMGIVLVWAILLVSELTSIGASFLDSLWRRF